MTIKERCVLCGRTFPPRYTSNVCDRHDGIDGILEVVADPGPDRDWQPRNTEDTLQRYADLLPLRPAVLPRGYLRRTPLVDAQRLARLLDVRALAVKDDGRNPTGSLKDRSSAFAVELAASLGARDVACASTGNAASSLAAACAASGLRARVFVPDRIPQGKLAQIVAFGAQVFRVAGTYDDAYYLCEEACREFGWYNRNCAVNPYLIEGKKTCAYEIAESIGADGVDWLAVAVGDGCTVSALAAGLSTMLSAGVIEKVPRILAVQPAGASPIARAWAAGTEMVQPMAADTAADAIAVARPRNAVKALRAVAATAGTFWTVTDAEIGAARMQLATEAGVFAEPAAAAGIAAVADARKAGVIEADARVVHVVTGTGLKAIGTGETSPARVKEIECDIAAVRRAVDEMDG